MPRPCAVRTSAWARQKMDFTFCFFRKNCSREREEKFSTLTKKNRPSESEGMNVCAANIHKMCMEEFYCYCAVCIQPKIVYPLETFWAEWNYSSGFGVFFLLPMLNSQWIINEFDIWIRLLLFCSFREDLQPTTPRVSKLIRVWPGREWWPMMWDVQFLQCKNILAKNSIDRLEDECQLSDVSSGFSNECQSKAYIFFRAAKNNAKFSAFEIQLGWVREKSDGVRNDEVIADAFQCQTLLFFFICTIIYTEERFRARSSRKIWKWNFSSPFFLSVHISQSSSSNNKLKFNISGKENFQLSSLSISFGKVVCTQWRRSEEKK